MPRKPTGSKKKKLELLNKPVTERSIRQKVKRRREKQQKELLKNLNNPGKLRELKAQQIKQATSEAVGMTLSRIGVTNKKKRKRIQRMYFKIFDWFEKRGYFSPEILKSLEEYNGGRGGSLDIMEADKGKSKEFRVLKAMEDELERVLGKEKCKEFNSAFKKISKKQMEISEEFNEAHQFSEWVKKQDPAELKRLIDKGKKGHN